MLRSCLCTHLPHNTTGLVEGNDGLGRLVVQVQTLPDGLFVVVHAAAGLAAFQEPLDHCFCLGINVQQQEGFSNLEEIQKSFTSALSLTLSLPLTLSLSYLLLKLLTLLHLTGIAINKVALGDVSLGDHGVLNHV